MKKLLVLFVVAVCALGWSTGHAAAQAATVTGKAVRWNGDPIVGATIQATTEPKENATVLSETTTGPDGSYSLTVPAGQTTWIQIRTFGTWWGYTYQTPFTLRPDEVLSQLYFALGPRDVTEVITLPAPISNVAPATGTTAEPPPAAPPAAAPPPISNVQPIVGSNEPPAQPQAPVSRAKPLTGSYLPRTGTADAVPGLGLALGLALIGLIAGLSLRRSAGITR